MSLEKVSTFNSQEYFVDDDDNIFADKEGKEKCYCNYHPRTQVKHNFSEAATYCPKCEREIEESQT